MRTAGKFLGLGAFTTLIDYMVYAVVLWLGMDYVLAIVLGYGCGLWINFIISRKYIFTQGIKIKHPHREFLAVCAIAAGGVLLNIAIVKLLSYSLFAWDPMLSRLIAIGIVFFWNFYARKWWVYH